MKEFKSEIILNINGINYNATLEDNETTRKFYEILPLNFLMLDLNNNEKYTYLDITLPANSENIKYINSGDIMLYEKNCLVLFYEPFNTNYRYTKLGKIDNADNLKNIIGNEDINIKVFTKNNIENK